jgi:hypothetical protein
LWWGLYSGNSWLKKLRCRLEAITNIPATSILCHVISPLVISPISKSLPLLFSATHAINHTTLPSMPPIRPLSRITNLLRLSKAYTTRPLQSQTQNVPPQYSIRTSLYVLSWAARGLLFAHLFMTHAYTISATWGPSMLPTFSIMGDYCLTSKYYRRGRDVKVSLLGNISKPQNLHPLHSLSAHFTVKIRKKALTL